MAVKSVMRARAMRKAMSPPELAVWLYLRTLKSEGWRFRRQSPEGPYILDFVCRNAKLVVEVDGVHHSSPDQDEHDRIRDAYLTERGFRVLRFWASDVLNEFEGVVQRVRQALGAEHAEHPGAIPVPSQHTRGPRYRSLVRLGLRRRE
jgi:very-short-patch-repair endonuclease